MYTENFDIRSFYTLKYREMSDKKKNSDFLTFYLLFFVCLFFLRIFLNIILLYAEQKDSLKALQNLFQLLLKI